MNLVPQEMGGKKKVEVVGIVVDVEEKGLVVAFADALDASGGENPL